VIEPPERVCYDLDEAATLLWDLEVARDALHDFEALSALAAMDHQVVVLHRKLFS
jgi:hypothetical protein